MRNINLFFMLTLILVSCKRRKEYTINKIYSDCLKFYHVITVTNSNGDNLIIVSKKVKASSGNTVAVGEDYDFSLKRLDEPLIQEIENGDTLHLFLSSRTKSMICDTLEVGQMNEKAFLANNLIDLKLN